MRVDSERDEIFDSLHRRSVIIIMVIAAVLAIKLAADFLAPIVIAMFLVALAWPIKTFLSRHMPDSLSYTGSFIALIGGLAIFVGAIYLSATEVMEVAPKYQKEISRFWKETKYELAVNGVDTTEKVNLEDVRNFASQLLLNFQESLLSLVLVIAYVMLALPVVTTWSSKLRNCFGEDRAERVLSALQQIGKSFQNYLVAMLICGSISAISTYLLLVLLGVDLAFTWGVLAFLLSFIPVIGAFLTVIPPVILAFLQFDNLGMPLAVFLSMGCMHMFIGNIIEPKIQGRMLSLSPLVVLISLSFWGFLWGIPGALLAAPLTHGGIIVCNHYERTRWFSCLLLENRKIDLSG
ncbi:MAG: AI-2E family transporter [Pseudomonadota bacterium]